MHNDRTIQNNIAIYLCPCLISISNSSISHSTEKNRLSQYSHQFYNTSLVLIQSVVPLKHLRNDFLLRVTNRRNSAVNFSLKSFSCVSVFTQLGHQESGFRFQKTGQSNSYSQEIIILASHFIWNSLYLVIPCFLFHFLKFNSLSYLRILDLLFIIVSFLSH